ncbi:MAG: 8-amino-7-oxononanoate synthase [Ginsengibacter sp.]
MREDFLHKRLDERKKENAYRTLEMPVNGIDFFSNDYLGVVRENLLDFDTAGLRHGSTGSRLLAGNYELIENTEQFIADFHEAETGLIFNSGYDANIGLLASVPQKGDVILYDQLIHASARDGIRLSFADSFSFFHNDMADLESKLARYGTGTPNIFIITESVFSMDGDKSPLTAICSLCEKFGCHLIVDEAHATGVIGKRGEGLVQQMQLQKNCFARLHTFGKACGVHGAIVLGSADLRNFLINFARPFIYSTALPEINVAAIRSSYATFPGLRSKREILENLIIRFRSNARILVNGITFLASETPIQAVIIPGNEIVKKAAASLRQNNFNIKAILYPTVPRGSERLRIVLHAYNTIKEVDDLFNILGG